MVLGEYKPADQIVAIVSEFAKGGGNVLVTRVDPDKGETVAAALEDARLEPGARAVVLQQKPLRDRGRGQVVVVCAGTSDLPVAREAVLTAELSSVSVGASGDDSLFRPRLKLVILGTADLLRDAVFGVVTTNIAECPPFGQFSRHINLD